MKESERISPVVTHTIKIIPDKVSLAKKLLNLILKEPEYNYINAFPDGTIGLSSEKQFEALIWQSLEAFKCKMIRRPVKHIDVIEFLEQAEYAFNHPEKYTF